MRTLMFFLLLFAASLVGAMGNAILYMEACAERGAAIIELAEALAGMRDVSGLSQQKAALRDAQNDLDNAIAPALKKAKDNPDLARAVREFYQAATSLFESGIPSSKADAAQTQSLQVAFATKTKALDLELKLSTK